MALNLLAAVVLVIHVTRSVADPADPTSDPDRIGDIHPPAPAPAPAMSDVTDPSPLTPETADLAS